MQITPKLNHSYTIIKDLSEMINKRWSELSCNYPADIYLLKVNNRNTRTRCETSSKLTIKTPERRHWRHSGIFIVNFELVSHLVLVFLSLTLNM